MTFPIFRWRVAMAGAGALLALATGLQAQPSGRPVPPDATTQEMESGAVTEMRTMSPALVAAAIAAQAGEGGSDDQDATEVPFAPTGTIEAITTQAAVAEVSGDVTALALAPDDTWTGTPTIDEDSDVNRKLIRGASATLVQVTLPETLTTDTWFQFANQDAGPFQFINNGTSVIKDIDGVTRDNTTSPITVWRGETAFIHKDDATTYTIFQPRTAIHAGANALVDDGYQATTPPIEDMVAAATTAQWDAVYANTSRKFALADADASAAAADPIGIAVAAAAADAAVTVMVSGYVRNDGWNFTAGNRLYVSAATPGLIVDAIQASGGFGREAVGVAISDDEAWVDFSGHPTRPGMVAKVTAGSYTVGTTDPDELFGGVIYVTSAGTITVPAVIAGGNFSVVTIGAIAVSVDPNAADLMYLDGVALADGDKCTNTSTAGDTVVFTYYDATGWNALSDGWTDGN